MTRTTDKRKPQADRRDERGTPPLVSIVIPVYNGANYLRQAIDSALAQTHPRIEVLVVNDGSSDGGETERIALSYGERIRYFAQENGGVASALNRGIREMKGAYFSWLSHDDLYAPDKVRIQVARLEKMAGRKAVAYSDVRLIDARGRAVENFRIGKRLARSKYLLILSTVLNGCTLLIPAAAFRDIGGFAESKKTTQDNEMWLRLAKGGYEFIRLGRPLVSSRIHPEQGSIRMSAIQRRESEDFFNWARSLLAEEMAGDGEIRKLIDERLAALKSDARLYDGRQYWNRMLAERFDERGVCRSDWPLAYNRWLHRQQRRTFAKLLARLSFAPGGARVCEIGPGTGFWTEHFARLGVSRYRGFEISAAAVRQLQGRFPGYEFVECDFGAYLPAAEEIDSFDLAVAVQVFLHVTDNDRFAKCWRNLGLLLKKGSYAIVLDAVAINPLRGRQQASGDGPGFNPALHNKVRNLQSYRQVAAESGFSLQRIVPAFTLTQSSFDFATALGARFWNFYYFRFLSRALRASGERGGYVLGALLYFLDGLLTPLTGKGISSKWLVFKKSE